MKRISEVGKEKKGYGCGEGASYNPFVHVGEFGSVGTAANPIDWHTGRIVHLLSQGEYTAWHIMRWHDAVVDIREQYPLDLQTTSRIADELGIVPPNRGKTTMTTDFLVTLTHHRQVAVSVKTSQSELKKKRTIEKQYIEHKYWEQKGIPFILAFKDELNRTFAENIRRVVAFYDGRDVTDDISVLKHMIAHKILMVDMETEPLNYAKLLKTHKAEVEK